MWTLVSGSGKDMKFMFKIVPTGLHLGRLTTTCTFFPNFGTRPVPLLTPSPSVRALTSFVPKKSHYDVLGLSRSATPKEIRQAFIKLSKQWHPDSNRNDPDNHKKFVQVNEAHSVLSKPQTRRDYDATLRAEQYVARHMNSPVYRSHAYTYRPEPEHDFHFKGHRYDNTEGARDHKADQKEKTFANFYVITLIITFSAVVVINHIMYNYIPDLRLNRLRKNITSSELEHHELIMTSEHDGMVVYYYAVPTEDDPDKCEVLAVKQSQISYSNMPEMHELNNVRYRKPQQQLQN